MRFLLLFAGLFLRVACLQAQTPTKPAAPPKAQITVEVHAGSQNEVPAAQVTVSQEQIEAIPAASVSSPLSSLITAISPGVAADSNGSFHPLGDHAEASFVIDGQPITDQQSRTFSTQISLNALEQMDVQEGAPRVDVGDKTSMVIVARTRSGLDAARPSGAFTVSRGGFNTTQISGRIAIGSRRFGSFSAADGMHSDRFLDAPEPAALHANGNAENLLERLDLRATENTALHLNLSASRSRFETPNTYTQQSLGQDQQETVRSFNAAPSAQHSLGTWGLWQTNLWTREDRVRYLPSANPLADTPATLQQARRLTNLGARSTLQLSRGRHTSMFGGEWKHTLLAERFATGLTDAAYNSPCLGTDGAPTAAVNYRDTAQCTAAGLKPNPDFLPGLLSIDLTRNGQLFQFQGRTDIKQEAIFLEDAANLRGWTITGGLRFDQYNGLTAGHGLQPRMSAAYGLTPLHTSLHLAYSRIFLTPYNENLIVASSNGPGSAAGALGASDSHLLHTGSRNQFNAGFTSQFGQSVSLSGEYTWKFTYGAYDFDVLLNSPLTFPTQFRKSKIDGGMLRVELRPLHRFSGYVTASHVRSRLFGPETGGLSFSPPYSNVARPDHDQGLAANAFARYQIGDRGPWGHLWGSVSYRYDGGLVAVAVPDAATALRLTGDEQAQMGLHCGAVFATVAVPLRTCITGFGATRLRIPATGTENDDKNPPRVAVRNLVDIAVGDDSLWQHGKSKLGARLEILNAGDITGLYNFLSTFSGTHFVSPRRISVSLHYAF